MTSNRLIVTDVDDVLLKWGDHFTRHHRAEVDPHRRRLPEGHILETFRADIFLEVSEQEGFEAIKDFNRGPHFSALHAGYGALPWVPRLAAEGWRFVAISCCGAEEAVAERRRVNLEAVFGPIFERLICLPLSATKAPLLRAYPGAVFVDDSSRHCADASDLGLTAFLMRRSTGPEPVVPAGVRLVTDWAEVRARLQQSNLAA